MPGINTAGEQRQADHDDPAAEDGGGGDADRGAGAHEGDDERRVHGAETARARYARGRRRATRWRHGSRPPACRAPARSPPVRLPAGPGTPACRPTGRRPVPSGRAAPELQGSPSLERRRIASNLPSKTVTLGDLQFTAAERIRPFPCSGSPAGGTPEKPVDLRKRKSDGLLFLPRHTATEPLHFSPRTIGQAADQALSDASGSSTTQARGTFGSLWRIRDAEGRPPGRTSRTPRTYTSEACRR